MHKPLEEIRQWIPMSFFPHLGIFLIWASRSKGVPPGPVTPLASLVHAKGNPHVFLDLEVRCASGGSVS